LIKFKIKRAANTHNSTRSVNDSNNRIDDQTDLAIEEAHEQARNPNRGPKNSNAAHESREAERSWKGAPVMAADERDRYTEYDDAEEGLEAADDEVENWVCDRHSAGLLPVNGTMVRCGAM
jgi:hypothetical protein